MWLDAVSECDFEGFEKAELDEIVALRKSMGLEVDEGDINDLIEEHSQELTTEELQELQALQEVEVCQGFSGEDEDEAPVVTTAEIKEVLAAYQKVTDFVEKKKITQKRYTQTVQLSNTMTYASRISETF